jgi:hypothetical protein
VKPFFQLGVWFGGCLMVIGLLSSCTIILIPFGVHLIWIGLLIMLAFVIGQRILSES